jgi:hypothetical protein
LGVRQPTPVPSLPSILAIVHAWQWPEPETLRAMLAPIEALDAQVRIVRAAERSDRPLGAATLVNEAARGAREDVLLVAEPCVRWRVEQLSRMVAAASDGLAIAGSCTRADSTAARPRLWTIPRRDFEELGGLDPRMWSIGELEDLRARAALAGLPQTQLSEDGEWRGPEPYPLRPAVHEFLSIRNRLLTATKTLPIDVLGHRSSPVSFSPRSTVADSADAAVRDRFRKNTPRR